MNDDNLATELLHTLKASIRESKISLIFYVKCVYKYIFMCYNIITLKKGDK